MGNEEDLYCPYNREHELNDDVTNYIIKESRKKGIKDNVLIRIISKDKMDEESVRNAFNEWIEQTDIFMKEEAKSNMVKQTIMAIIGLIFISLSVLLQSRLNAVIFTVLSTIGAFAIWEAASIWIVENPKLRHHARTIGKWKEEIGLEIENIK